MLDKIIVVEKCGKKRTLYRKMCSNCSTDMGYKRKKDNKLCRRCSQLKRRSDRLKALSAQYTHVDFNDYRDIPYCKDKSIDSGLKRNYRCKCKFCGEDKGYVRHMQFDTRCYKCVMTDDRRQKFSCQSQGIDIAGFDGFVSPRNTLIRQSEMGKRWIVEVLYKSNFTCDRCKVRGGSLCAHHLKAFATYPEQRFDVDNGVCLCKDCHKKFHAIYGKGKNTGEQYEKFKADCSALNR